MADPEDRTEQARAREDAGAPGEEASARMRFSDATERYFEAAREQVRAHPLAAALAAFTAGCLVAVATRASFSRRERDE